MGHVCKVEPYEKALAALQAKYNEMVKQQADCNLNHIPHNHDS